MRQWFKNLFQHKDSATAPARVMFIEGQPQFTPRRYDKLAEEGFQKNVIVYRAVNLISENASSIKFKLFQTAGNTKREIETHPLLDLLAKPNPMQGQDEFFDCLYGFFLIAGNSYVEAVGPEGKPPRELWCLRPDRMKVIPGSSGLPKAYQFELNSKKINFEVDERTGHSPILHSKTFHPLHDWYGLSPLEAAAFSVDQHNAAGTWNAKLLMNSAKPSGALIFNPENSKPGTLTDEQRSVIRQDWEDAFAGEHNAGRPLLLEGGMDWKELALSPKEMDWLSGKEMSAKEIGLAYNVPSQLLGIEGSLTFANMEQAKLALHDDAVSPLVEHILADLNRWLVPAFGDNLKLEMDMDSITALDSRRNKTFERVRQADFMTINEKRRAVGLDDIEGGDTLLIQANLLPLDAEPQIDDDEIMDPDTAEGLSKMAYGEE